MLKAFKVGDKVRIITEDVRNDVEGVILSIVPAMIDRYLICIDAQRFSESSIGWTMKKDSYVIDDIKAAFLNNPAFKFWYASADNITLVDNSNDSVTEDKYHDAHYSECVVEPIVLMQVYMTKEQFKGFLMGNALKYRLRAGHKEDAQQDIDKALRYEKWLKEYEQTGEIIV